ncbi:MAG: Rab family GTPase [Campylobacterota bacterium]|nr:Rab family GTPase [Campylobacterota bacterium]
MIRKKVLLLGDFSVGKTSLIQRYIDDTFDDKYLTTIGVKISKKLLILDEVEYELLIWDIEGATSIKKIPPTYFKGASGAIFVCDVSRLETIENLNEHINTFLMINNNARYVIAYNKEDLLTVAQKEVLNLAGNTFLTSAKEGSNVEKLFMTLAKEMQI